MIGREARTMSAWEFRAEDLAKRAGGAPVAGLVELLEIAYRTSLHREEGAVPLVRCLLTQDPSQTPCMVRFRDKPPLSVQLLRKLALALDRNHTVLAVCSTPQLCVLGVLDAQVSAIALPRLPTTKAVHVEIQGCAEIRLEAPGGVCVFLKDRYASPTAAHEIVPMLPGPIVLSVFARAQAEAGGLYEKYRSDREFVPRWTFESNPMPGLTSALARWLTTVVATVRRSGRGGSLLLAADAAEALAEVADSHHGLAPWTSGEPGASWSGCVLVDMAASFITPRHPPMVPDLNERYFKDLLDGRRFATAETEQTAFLARIDGAVVLDDSLCPVAVGAKLKTSNMGALPARFTEHVERGRRGMRHRSMACGVARLAGSLGVVISADGDASIFSNGHEPQVLELVL